MGHGGHTRQMCILIKELEGKTKLCYVVNKKHLPNPNIKGLEGEIYPIIGARTITSRFFYNVWGTLAMFLQAFLIYLKARPDMVISTGTSPAIPFMILGKFMRIKTVFIESWSRPYNLSTSGRLMYPIVDLFFVQWKSLAKRYRKAVYKGRFL
jgi:UDP-N-acetylglucosamine:LPS N-acetylglucosamine transferase